MLSLPDWRALPVKSTDTNTMGTVRKAIRDTTRMEAAMVARAPSFLLYLSRSSCPAAKMQLYSGRQIY